MAMVDGPAWLVGVLHVCVGWPSWSRQLQCLLQRSLQIWLTVNKLIARYGKQRWRGRCAAVRVEIKKSFDIRRHPAFSLYVDICINFFFQLLQIIKARRSLVRWLLGYLAGQGKVRQPTAALGPPPDHKTNFGQKESQCGRFVMALLLLPWWLALLALAAECRYR